MIIKCFTFDPPFETGIGFDHSILIRFNVTRADFGINVFLHNKDQMYTPKIDNIFGSEVIAANLDRVRINAKPEGTGYDISQYFKMKKTLWKALDTPAKRCNSYNTEANTTQCLTDFLEQKIGCSMGLAKSNSSAPR